MQHGHVSRAVKLTGTQGSCEQSKVCLVVLQTPPKGRYHELTEAVDSSPQTAGTACSRTSAILCDCGLFSTSYSDVAAWSCRIDGLVSAGNLSPNRAGMSISRRCATCWAAWRQYLKPRSDSKEVRAQQLDAVQDPVHLGVVCYQLKTSCICVHSHHLHPHLQTTQDAPEGVRPRCCK